MNIDAVTVEVIRIEQCYRLLMETTDPAERDAFSDAMRRAAARLVDAA